MGVAYNPRIVTDGLVLALDAGNVKSYPGSGTACYDLSSKNNNSTLVSGVSYSSESGGNFVFDGTDDYINCGTGSSLTPGNLDFTISIWIKIPFSSTGEGSPSQWGPIVSKGCSTSAPAGSWWLAQNSTNVNRITFNGSSEVGGTFNIAITTPVLSNGWHNIVATKSGSNAYIYTDSALSSTDTTATTNLSNTSALLIGSNVIGSPKRTSMSLAQVQMYNRALSDVEIKQNFNTMRGRYGI